ncbi:MAG: hypothetical protein WC962_01715 [Phycisphaerae bacterium]
MSASAGCSIAHAVVIAVFISNRTADMLIRLCGCGCELLCRLQKTGATIQAGLCRCNFVMQCAVSSSGWISDFLNAGFYRT